MRTTWLFLGWLSACSALSCDNGAGDPPATQPLSEVTTADDNAPPAVVDDDKETQEEEPVTEPAPAQEDIPVEPPSETPAEEPAEPEPPLDAGPPEPEIPPVNPYEGNLACGAARDVTCALPDEVCCQGLTGARCRPAAGSCGPMTARVSCDGPEDCEFEEPLCCATINMSSFSAAVSCAATCAGTMMAAILCHTDDDCGPTMTCKECQPPGGPSQTMCVVNDQCPR